MIAFVRDTRRLVIRGSGIVLCIAGVPILVLTLVRVLFGTPISEYLPVINDEVAYWHQAYTFSHAGFGGGYYTLDEATNKSGLTPFGPHGPGFAVLYGFAGRVFGWHRDSVVVLNLIAIGLAGCVWVALSPLSDARLVLSGLVLVTFWHMVFWAPTGMQEPFHHAGAIVMAAFFVSALVRTPRAWTSVIGWIVLAGLSFVRPSWILLMPLWALATTRTKRWPVVLAALAASGICAGVVVFAYSRTVAPYSSGFFFLRAMSATRLMGTILDNANANLARLSRSDQFEPIEFVQRYQYLGLLTAAAVAAVVSVWKTRSVRTGATAHFLIVVATMAVAFAAMLALYEFASMAEHRVLSAFLLFGALVCLAAPGRLGPIIASTLIVSSLLTARSSLINFEAVHRDSFKHDDRGVAELAAAVKDKVVYHRGAPRWCNTLLTSQYPREFVAIPPGIGLSVAQNPDRIAGQPRSRYLLLDEQAKAGFKVPLNLEPLATLPYGTIYVNRDANCPSLSSP